jgi:hypothetical protein
MKRFVAQLKSLIESVNPKTRRRVLWTLAIVVVFQMYFVRELLAAELLFGAMFAVLFALAGICYLLGTAGERGLDWAEVGVRAIAGTARKSYAALEEISKKSFRHPHSESAQ